MNRKLYLLLPALVLASSMFFMYCKSKKTQSAEVDGNEYLLAAGQIYNFDAVHNALKQAGNSHKSRSNKLFIKAIEEHRKTGQPAKSINMLREAVRIYPAAKIYYELGNILLSAKMLDEAGKAYKIAAGLDDEDLLERIVFKQACVDIALGKTDDAYENLDYLFNELGYANHKEFTTDPYLEPIRNTERYKMYILENFTEKADRMAQLFNKFSNVFPQAVLPFEINEQQADKYNEDNNISYQYADFIEGMEDARFSRDVSNQYIYMAKLRQTEKYTAIVYSSVELMADTLPPLQTYIATYDAAGKPVDRRVFSCHCSPLNIKTGLFTDDNLLEIKEYRRNWKYDPREKGYAGNSINGHELKSTMVYKLNDEGRFVKYDEPAQDAQVIIAESSIWPW